MPPRALLFDLDGTLIDTNHQHVDAWRSAFAAFGIALGSDLISEQIGKGGDLFVSALLGAEAEKKDGDALRTAHRVAFHERFIYAAPAWLPGAKEMLAATRAAGLRAALATSTDAADLSFLEARMNVRFDELFDAVVTADASIPSKPEPDILVRACDELGLDPLACAMVGDSLHDATAARRAGLAFLGVTSGFVSAKRFDEAGARFVCPSLIDLAASLTDACASAWPSRVDFHARTLEQMMRVALGEAQRGVAEGEAPLGAAIFDSAGKLVATGHNRAIATGDVTEHAEIDALRALARAGMRLGRGATLVSTLEPCVMCLGAAMMNCVDVVVFGLRAPADGGTRRICVPRSPENSLPRVRGGILADEAFRAFERWLAGSAAPNQRAYAEQLLRETM